ncbi:MAG TPA: DUF2631 domain-containing protein [Pseudonocardiaceae bacterium]|nr:DUF2631 domain-containing protein [Pseudonocardiaceae bacterium]
MAATDQHPADQHSTGHGMDPHGLDPNREPSADWGWHGGFPLAGPIMGWFTAFALFAMLIGNHRSHVEDVWLVSLGLLLVVMLIGSHLNSRKSRRR